MAVAVSSTARRAVRGDALPLALWLVVAALGIVVGGRLTAAHPEYHTDASPFHGHWFLLYGPGIIASLLLGAAVVVAGPMLADRMAWPRVLAASTATAFAWSVALAVSVGGHGLLSPLHGRSEYLAGIPFVDGPADFLRHFSARLPAYPTHVKGHPPGLVLLLWAIDRVGLRGPFWATLLVVAVGATTVTAVLLAVRELGGEVQARRVAPFLVLAPAAVWMATSGDALFSGVGAWAVTTTVIATRRRGASLAVVSGLTWTAAVLLSYGLVLLAPIAVGVAWWRRRVDVLVVTGMATVGLLVVIGLATGFWWPSGLAATHRAYLTGYAPHRAATVFIWLDLCAFALALGPAVAPALARLRRGPVALLVGGALTGLALADLTLLSKGEVERIWLPWAPWVLLATVALPLTARRRWLALQAATGVAIQLALRSTW